MAIAGSGVCIQRLQLLALQPAESGISPALGAQFFRIFIPEECWHEEPVFRAYRSHRIHIRLRYACTQQMSTVASRVTPLILRAPIRASLSGDSINSVRFRRLPVASTKSTNNRPKFEPSRPGFAREAQNHQPRRIMQ